MTTDANGCAAKVQNGNFITAIALTAAEKAGTIIRVQLIKLDISQQHKEEKIMGNKQVTNGDIQARIMKGWKPNRYLSNMSMAYFANPGDWVGN